MKDEIENKENENRRHAAGWMGHKHGMEMHNGSMGRRSHSGADGGRCYRREYELAETKDAKRDILDAWLKAVTARSDARKEEIGRYMKELE